MQPYIEASNAGLMIKDADVNIINGQFYVGDAAETTFLKWDGTSMSIAGNGSGVTNINGGNIQTGTITADKLTILDGGEIRFGNLDRNATNLSTFSGLRMFKSGSSYELSGYDAGVKQAYFSSDGRFYAGGGNVRMDNEGITLTIGSEYYDRVREIKWEGGAGVSSSIGYFEDSLAGNILYLDSPHKVSIRAQHATAPEVELYASDLAGFDSTLGILRVGIDQPNWNGTIFLGGVTTISNGLTVGAFSETHTETGIVQLQAAAAPAAPWSGYGKLYWSSSRNWPFAMGADGVEVPIGVAEISPSLGDFVLTGAAFAATVNNQYLVFRDGLIDIADVNVVMPIGWKGRSLYCDLFWWTGATTANVYWSVEARYHVDGGALQNGPNLTGGAIVNANNVIRKTTISMGTLNPATVPAGLGLRIYRIGTHASDNYTGSAFLLSARFYVI